MADRHTIYKNGAKEIADRQRPGDHLHGQVDDGRRRLVVPHPLVGVGRRGHDVAGRARLRRRPSALSPTVPALAGRPGRRLARADAAVRPERQLLQAVPCPTPGRPPPSPGATTTAPAGCASSATAPACRVESRIPGADVNPLPRLRRRHRRRPPRHRERARPGPGLRGQRLRRPRRRRASRRPSSRPSTCSSGSEVAKAAFGDEVHHHLLNTARQEWLAFNRAVTDWELRRGFERL